MVGLGDYDNKIIAIIFPMYMISTFISIFV